MPQTSRRATTKPFAVLSLALTLASSLVAATSVATLAAAPQPEIVSVGLTCSDDTLEFVAEPSYKGRWVSVQVRAFADGRTLAVESPFKFDSRSQPLERTWAVKSTDSVGRVEVDIVDKYGVPIKSETPTCTW